MDAITILVGLFGILVGIWQFAVPVQAWRLNRLAARSKGLATDDSPDPKALLLIRLGGIFFIAVGLVFVIVGSRLN